MVPGPIAMAAAGEERELAQDPRGAVKKRLARMMEKMTLEQLQDLEDKGKEFLAAGGDCPRQATNPSGSNVPCHPQCARCSAMFKAVWG